MLVLLIFSMCMSSPCIVSDLRFCPPPPVVVALGKETSLTEPHPSINKLSMLFGQHTRSILTHDCISNILRDDKRSLPVLSSSSSFSPKLTKFLH
ncbi:hypothetical protein HanRHA438_Chr13g0626371 [Helianthus annuus]|nr:hypothetical protein HanRHA438_Chr13g0626371 [Helianthus annuus]